MVYMENINLLFPSLTLNVLTYPLILGIIKSNGLIALSKYPIKYLELVFVLTNSYNHSFCFNEFINL